VSTATRPEILDDRLDTVAWGLVAVMVGVIALPGGAVAYALAAATGAGFLLVNGVRRLAGLPIRWFSLVLGIVLLAAATAAFAGVAVDVFAAFFIVLGVVVIGGALLRRE
jgi:hypothetical protein